MKLALKKITTGLALLAITELTFASQFVVELDNPLPSDASFIESKPAVKLDRSFAAGSDSYAVFTVKDKTTLIAALEAISVIPEKVSEVLFVNSPVVGGGQPAGNTPRDGHNVYVIERPIPGVGFFGLEKKQKISKGSISAMAKLGEIIEWDRSYLTSEGTYCVYRADSPETLQEHGALAGAPIGKITHVTPSSDSN